MPCPHFNITITQRSKNQSSVAGAAYQSGETLFSEYDQKRKSYSEKRGIVYTEIMLPANARRNMQTEIRYGMQLRKLKNSGTRSLPAASFLRSR